MLIKQLVDDCLGNSSYLLASEEAGLAVVIDPQRDVDKYLRLAEGLGLRLTHALDTHLHADFITGVRELAHSANVVIGIGEKSDLQFEHTGLKEGDSIQLGELSIGVLDTPGHTPEHITYTLGPADDSVPKAIFTGGTLIVGGAARTDLLGHDMSRPLAAQLYDSLHNKLMQYPDDVEVYPTHGAGSFCAVPVSSERVTTIGLERTQNRLLKAHNENEFVELALSGLPSYPVYYSEMRAINQRGPRILGGVPDLEPVEAAELKALLECCDLSDLRAYSADATSHRKTGSHRIRAQRQLSRGV